MIEEKRDFYIDGQWVKPSQINDLEVIDPSTEEVCAIISLGSNKDTDDAVRAADFINCKKIIEMHFDTFGHIEIDQIQAKQTFANAGIELTLMEIGQTINL